MTHKRIKVVRVHIYDELEVQWFDDEEPPNRFIVRYTAPPLETRKALHKKAEEKNE